MVRKYGYGAKCHELCHVLIGEKTPQTTALFSSTRLTKHSSMREGQHTNAGCAPVICPKMLFNILANNYKCNDTLWSQFDLVHDTGSMIRFNWIRLSEYFERN